MNYNQSAFLPRRLASIFAQTEPLAALTLHDDASTDGSPTLAARLAAQAGRTLTLCPAPRHFGSPFALWAQAAAAATADFLWIAEADDDAEPDFLARLLEAASDPAVLIAAANSRPATTGEPANYQAFYEMAGAAPLFAADGLHSAGAVAAPLAVCNIFLNVSAVLFRRTALVAALARVPTLATWRAAGDWRLYWELLHNAEGSVAIVAAPLNHHHRAATTASRQSPQVHLREIRRMHALTAAALNHPPGLAARQAAFRRHAAAVLTGGAGRTGRSLL